MPLDPNQRLGVSLRLFGCLLFFHRFEPTPARPSAPLRAESHVDLSTTDSRTITPMTTAPTTPADSSTQNTAEVDPRFLDPNLGRNVLPPTGQKDLAHIDGEAGPPIVGHTFQFVRDCEGMVARLGKSVRHQHQDPYVRPSPRPGGRTRRSQGSAARPGEELFELPWLGSRHRRVVCSRSHAARLRRPPYAPSHHAGRLPRRSDARVHRPHEPDHQQYSRTLGAESEPEFLSEHQAGDARHRCRRLPGHPLSAAKPSNSTGRSSTRSRPR